ncbi:MAG: diguanylate cyclase domain-containing protein, partial [Alphaproteobacteria bacterium]
MAEGSLPVLPPSRGRLRRPLTKNDFEEKLWELLTTRDELTAGCVQLVDLMEVHERFIRHWGRIGEMVHMLVQMIISDHLDEGDVYIRVKEHNYAMVFADLSLPEAQEKCAYIAAKISHYLLGTPMDKPGERLQTTALTLDQGMLESGIPLYEAFCQTVEAAKMATAPAFSELQTDPAESEPTAFVELESRNRNGEDSLISNQDFEERLNLACSGTDSEAGCVAGMQVLDIEHIQQHFEAYWDRVGEQVMTVVQMVIQDHLSEGDRYTKWEEKSFLIHFRDKSPEESRAICQRIAKKITQLLEELDEEAHHLAVDHGVVELERVVISQEKRRLSEIERRMREKLSKSADRIQVKSPPKLWTSDQ